MNEKMAAVSLEIGGVPKFDSQQGHTASLGPRWRKWKKSFEYFLTAKAVANVAQKKALLLHCAGPEVQELFETLTDPGGAEDAEEEDANEYEVAVRTLDAYFITQVNEPYERHVFRSLKQEDNETVDGFVSRLRRQAQFCNFTDADVDIRDQLIEKCRSPKLRRKLLERRQGLTLAIAMEIARVMETVDYQVKSMGLRKPVGLESKSTEISSKEAQTSEKTCFRCGREGHISNSKNCM